MPLPVIGAAVAGVSVVIARYLVPYIITKAIITLGLTLITFVGLDALTDYIVSEVRNMAGGVGADTVSILALAGAFDWIEVVMASWVAAINIRSIRGAFRSLSFAAGGQ